MATTENEANEPNLTVDARPTKEFFVDTITRDIPLDRAISDLVDNCVDGAKRLRDENQPPAGVQGGERYKGLWVKIKVNADEFEISDNCGGISLITAQQYAFKFGRASGFKATPNSVGQFGVGMKRALFKMGDNFEVRTADAEHSFRITVNVPDWLRVDSWDFKISDLTDNKDGATEPGTSIRSWNLHRGVSELFAQDYFVRNLKRHILVSQQHFMRNGLIIEVEGETLIASDWQLQRGSGIEPMFQRHDDVVGVKDDGAGTQVHLKTRVYAGVGPSSQIRAGWYIFCNGRCILEADQSSTTGWGELAGEGGVNIPRYHNQFARFRGYAFLDCEDAEKLPWNTTKTDLDLEDPAYRLLKTRLVAASRPVIDFLNELDRETDFEANDRELSGSLQVSISTPIADLPENAQFRYSPPQRRGPPLRSISFKKPENEINELKSKFSVAAARDVGVKSFEYAYQRLVVEDDL